MIHWSKFPFVRILIPLIAGITLCYFLGAPIIIPVVSILSGIAFLILIQKRSKRIQSYRWRWLFGILLNLIILAIGYKITESTFSLRERDHFSNIIPTPQLFTGKVIEPPSERGKSFKIVVEISSVRSYNVEFPCHGKVIAYINKEPDSLLPRYGDVIIFSKPAARIEKPGNPGEFNYAAYLEHNQIYHSVFLKSDDYKIIARDKGKTLKSFAVQMRSKTLNQLKKYNQSTDEFAVAAAILAGYDDLSDKQREIYSDTGVIHILSVSGLHVGVIYLLAEFLLSFLSKRNRNLLLKPFLILLSIWFYALFTGMSVPVMRASLMFTLILIGKALRMQSNNFNILAAAAFVLLLLDPRSLFNVGFQLSFAAVAGIMVFKSPIYKLWSPQNPLLAKIWELLAISFAAQIFITPFILYYFHRFPVYFAIANLVAVPLSGLIIYAGVAFLIFSFIPVISQAFYWVLISEIKVLNLFLEFINKLPGSIVENIHVSLFSAITLLVLMTCSSFFIVSARKRYIWPALLCLLILASASVYRKLEIKNQQLIVFHKINRYTMISFIDADHQTILTDSILGSKISEAKFNLDGLTVEAGIRNRSIKTLHSPVNNLTKVYSLPEFYMFKGKRIAFLSGNCLLPDQNSRLKVDYVLLSNNPSASFSEISSHFPGAVLIADNSCNSWKIEEMKIESRSIGIPLYDLKQDGALVVRIST